MRISDSISVVCSSDLREHLDLFTHAAFQVTAYEPYVALAERLNALAPIDGPARTILFPTGAEAVENAFKIARIAHGRRAVVAFAGGFHGRSLMAMALNGQIARRTGRARVGRSVSVWVAAGTTKK